MTTEQSEDYETPITGLPLFTQTVTAVREQREVARPLTSVAHLSTVSTTAPITGTLDWSLVSALRAQSSEQLSQAVAADRGRLDKVAQEELGRTIVLDLIETTVADRVNAGMTTLPGAAGSGSKNPSASHRSAGTSDTASRPSCSTSQNCSASAAPRPGFAPSNSVRPFPAGQRPAPCTPRRANREFIHPCPDSKSNKSPCSVPA